MDTHRLPTRQLALLPCLIFLLLVPSSVQAQNTGAPAADLLDDIVAVSAGGSHACALTKGGGVKCWGRNSEDSSTWGILGNGLPDDSATPVDVIGLSSGVKAISAGYSHTCAVTAAGGVKCWGVNRAGQLGSELPHASSAPIDVPTLSSIVAVSAGGFHTCALTRAGGVKCWGDNHYGQLGNGTTENSVGPVDVNGLRSNVVALDAGFNFTCALTTAGGVKCWGDNNRGQLGNGTTTPSSTPVNVNGLGGGAAAVHAGDLHTCAQMIAGGARCWGFNRFGQLGNGTAVDSLTPVVVIALTRDVASMSVGGYHTCVVTTVGAAQCWGWNDSGQLGDGTADTSLTATNVSGLASNVAAISAGAYFTCAVVNAGHVKCWGNNRSGQLGNGATNSISTPVEMSTLHGKVAAVSAGASHSCVLTTTGGIQCWGSNQFGQFGDGTLHSSHVPVATSGLQAGVKVISAGFGHTCAITDNGGLLCWGYNDQGQVGNGTLINSTVPASVSGLGTGVATVSTGWRHTCAVTTTGGVQCWGDNDFGQLGDGTNYDRVTPVAVRGLNGRATAVSAGGIYTCALMTTGIVMCWGSSMSDPSRWTPKAVDGALGDGVTAIHASRDDACALMRNGGVLCWDEVWQEGPWKIPSLSAGVKAVSVGVMYVCALTTVGIIRCRGENSSGQLGNGATDYSDLPVDVNWQSSNRAMTISASEAHTCAQASDDSVWCWGNNEGAQIGIDPGWTPVNVLAVQPPLVLDLNTYLPAVRN